MHRRWIRSGLEQDGKKDVYKRQVGETPEEKAFIEDTLNVPYVVGGITVITVLSTMLAGFVINML